MVHLVAPFLLAAFLFVSPPAAAQWQPQASGTSAHFRAVHAVGRRVVWVGGSAGTFVRTTDGGKTWQAGVVPGAETLDFRGVWARSGREALLMSAGPADKGAARLYRTTDGGRSWQLVYQTDRPGVFFDGLAFWNRRQGLVFSDPVNGNWFLLRTSDGGRTWQAAAPARLPALHTTEAAFAASNSALVTQGRRHVWIGSGGGAFGRVFRSSDRGQTWHVADTPIAGSASAGVFGLRFRDARTGMAVGGDYRRDTTAVQNVAITTDGGRSWQAVTPAEPPGLKEAVVHLPGNRWLVVGPSGSSLSADAGQSWQTLGTTSLHAVSCAGSDCWGVGANGAIGHIRLP